VIEKNPAAGATLMFQRAKEQMKIQQRALGKPVLYLFAKYGIIQ